MLGCAVLGRGVLGGGVAREGEEDVIQIRGVHRQSVDLDLGVVESADQ
jgi:hypothetical protein